MVVRLSTIMEMNKNDEGDALYTDVHTVGLVGF